jgi:hypothetical protein
LNDRDYPVLIFHYRIAPIIPGAIELFGLRQNGHGHVVSHTLTQINAGSEVLLQDTSFYPSIGKVKNHGNSSVSCLEAEQIQDNCN